MNEYRHDIITLSGIDFQDMFFHVTRPANDDLKTSVYEFGILKPCVLEKKDNYFRIVSGFNRLALAKELGISGIPVHLVDRVDAELFLSLVIPRAMTGRIGPVGKLRALRILKDYCGLSDADERIGRKTFGISSDFLNDSHLADKLLSLPASLKGYIDARDPGFRCLKILAGLPVYAAEFLAQIIDVIPLRINIFRSMIDIMADLIARDGHLPDFSIPVADHDRKKLEEMVYSRLYANRYPRYSALHEEAEMIIGKLSRKGVSVDFPEFFESGSCNLVIQIKSSDNAGTIGKRLESIDTHLCEKLAKLL